MAKGIYCYIDNKNNKVVYIGKDSNIDKQKRRRNHLAQSTYSQQPINRILQNNPDRYNYRILVQLSNDFSDDDLNDLEGLFIKELNTYHYNNPHGFNFTKGGDGATGCWPSLETRKKISESRSKAQNTTGFYRVSKQKNDCKQGFTWCYQYQYKSIKKSISNINLLKLKEKVSTQGLPWKILDEEQAKKSLEENNRCQHKKWGDSRNTTGFYRVYKHKNEKYKKGFLWCYYMKQNRQYIYASNLETLQGKIEERGLDWKIIDDEKAQKSFLEDRG